MKRLALILVLGFLGGLIDVACAGTAQPDVVVVTLDTTRADRIGSYGYGPADTPVLDALAAKGRRYTRAYSPAPLTIPAHSALFTGRSPATLGLRSNGGGLADEAVTLAERFQDAGYSTAATVGAYVTTSTWGFGQGFETYLEDLGGAPERPADRVVEDGLRWLDRHQTAEPRFLWVHLFDAHGSSGEAYDAEIAFMDAQVGRLVAACADRPTLFVVVADHGEGLGDHGEQEHGLYVYDATQHIPYIVAGPGIVPAEVSEPVSLMDVAPTLLAHLSLPPLPEAEGRVAPGTPEQPVVLQSWGLQQRFGLAPHHAVIWGKHKLIGVPKPELYDLLADPAELNDLAREQPSRVAAMSALLPSVDVEGPVTDHRDEHTAMLERLGYVQAETQKTVGALPDPKDHVALIRSVERADELVATGQIDAALDMLADVRVRYPEVLEVSVRLSQLLVRTERVEEALEILERTAAAHPDNSTVTQAMARALEASGRTTEAADSLEGLARSKPFLPGLAERAFDARARAPGGTDRAIAMGLEFLRSSAGDPGLAAKVGVALARRGDLAQARPWLEKGRGLSPPLLDLNLFLAQIADQAGRSVETRRLLESEVAAHPNSARAVFALAMALERTKEWQAQLKLVCSTLDEADAMTARTGDAPGVDLGVFWVLKARALMQLDREEDARVAVNRGLRDWDVPMLWQLEALLARP